MAGLSVSTGMLGGARAQYHLRKCFVFLKAYPINPLKFIVPFAADKIDADGRVTDERTMERIRHPLEALVELTREVKG